MLGLIHHEHPIQVGLDEELMNPFVAEAELYKLDVFVARELELVACLRHFASLVDLGKLDSVEIVSYSDAHYEAVSHEYFQFVDVVILCLPEKHHIVELLFPIFLQLVLRQESVGSRVTPRGA